MALSERAPWVVIGSVKNSKAPTNTQRYFLHEIKVSETLAGTSVEDPKVLQEIVFPDEKGAYPEGPFIAFLAPLPSYTAYKSAKEQGASYRMFGGKAGVLSLSGPAGDDLRALLREAAALGKLSGAEREGTRRALLFRALAISDPRVQNDAAAALESLSLAAAKLSSAEVGNILTALQGNALKGPAAYSLVHLLQKSGDAGSVAALKTLANGPAGPAKWAAIPSLAALGVPRSFSDLTEDYARAEPEQKSRALAVILDQPGEQTTAFLQNMLAGPGGTEAKRDAIAQMERKGGAVYEAIFLEQTKNRDEQVASEALLALGRISSSPGLDRILELVDSPSPTLRSAARMALMQSNDPRAVKIFQKRFENEAAHSHEHFN